MFQRDLDRLEERTNGNPVKFNENDARSCVWRGSSDSKLGMGQQCALVALGILGLCESKAAE